MLTLGYEDPGWTGAPWHPTNVVWVKRPVWVVESTSTDPNYRYGPCEGWVVKGSYFHAYKRITDPNGQLWKGVYWPAVAMETPDGDWKLVKNMGWFVVDLRRDHGSALPGAYREGAFRTLFATSADPTLFTRAGYVKFSK